MEFRPKQSLSLGDNLVLCSVWEPACFQSQWPLGAQVPSRISFAVLRVGLAACRERQARVLRLPVPGSRPTGLSFLAAAGGPGALSVLPALNRSPLGPLGQDEGSKQAPGWQRSWTPAPPRWANALLIRAAIGARRAPGPPARPPWQLTAASPPGGRTPVASASHPRVRKHPVLGTPRENQLFAKDSVPFVDRRTMLLKIH